MPRFFTDALSGDRASLTGEDAAHISRSLRLKPGEGPPHIRLDRAAQFLIGDRL